MIIVGDYNWREQKKVLQWTGGCRTHEENVDSMEIAFRSLHSLLVYDRRQVSLSFPLHQWRIPKKTGLTDVTAQHKVRATGSFNFICVSRHGSHRKCKRQELPALGLLKPCDLALASSQIRTILLHHFGCVCISRRLESEFLARITFTGPESFQQAD